MAMLQVRRQFTMIWL